MIKIAGIATMPGRQSQVIKTIQSLNDQVDSIHVYCNYEAGNEVLLSIWNNIGVHVKLYDIISAGDLGDAGKFYHVPKDCIYFACDDDIEYPANYCDYMEAKAKQHGCPVSLHGRIIKTPVNSYYKSGIKFRCLDTVDSDVEVNVIGTGTLCFDTSKIKISLADFELKNMADIWFSIAAKKQGVKLRVVQHEKGYLKYQQVENTIYDQFKNNDKIQTQIVNKYL